MKSSVRVVGLLLALFTAGVTGLQAQRMAPGTWTGKAIDPGGEEIPLTFEVASAGDSLSIMIVSPTGESMALSKISFDEGKLLFTWEPGVMINCVLSPVEGGGYSGPCTDESGGSGVITMTPPKP